MEIDKWSRLNRDELEHLDLLLEDLGKHATLLGFARTDIARAGDARALVQKVLTEVTR